MPRAVLTAEEFTECPRFNIAPSQGIPVVRLNRDNGRAIVLVRWGLILRWAKEPSKAQPINARAETVTTSGMFKQAFIRRHCVVPADGFYEWRKLDANTRQPMFVHFPDGRVFGFAGLWERWRPPGDEDVEPVDACTIINLGPVVTGQWIRWVVRARPSPAKAEGAVTVYVDGVPKLDIMNIKVGYDPQNARYAAHKPPPYFDYADVLLYRANGDNFQRVFFDEVRFADTLADALPKPEQARKGEK